MAKKVTQLDTETAAVEAVGKSIKDLVGSSGWAEARKRLVRKVAELKMISGIDIQQATPETIIQVIASKNVAADILMAWLRDVEGTAEQHEGNQNLITEAVEGIVVEIG